MTDKAKSNLTTPLKVEENVTQEKTNRQLVIHRMQKNKKKEALGWDEQLGSALHARLRKKDGHVEAV